MRVAEGLYYYGARYLDPKYSMWLSTDPALGEYIPGLDKDKNKNLPGMGGLFNQINANLFCTFGNNPVRYVDPDGRKLFVCGSKEYTAAVQRELSKMCPGTIVNFDTGEVILSTASKTTNPKGYEIISALVNSSKTNTIWIGTSKMKDANGDTIGNNTQTYNTKISLQNGEFICDYNIENGIYGSMNSIINFNPDSWTGGEDDNYSTFRPPYIGLSHECGHSEGINNGTEIFTEYQYEPGTTPSREVNSLKRENEMRVENHLTTRSYYWQP